jgi:hypothetical protein
MPFIRFTVELRIEEIPLLTGGLLLFDRHTMATAQGSCRMPVTCQETFIPGAPPPILKRLPMISRSI